MQSYFAFASLVALAAALPTGDVEACPAPVPCASYTLINTRGTTEPQGESLGFTAINAIVNGQRPGGKIIINQIHTTLATKADECFILEGYSQGATATVDALDSLTDAAFAAVKGIFLIGNPVHQAGLACNVDIAGGKSTADVDGVYVAAGLKTGISSAWVPKTLDVCNYGDGICDTKHGDGITIEHIEYIMDEGVHKLGSDFILKQLQGGSTS